MSATRPGGLAAKAASGTVLTGPINAGEPITTTRVHTRRNWPGVAHGRVIIGVAVTDTAIMRVVHPGDRVDLMNTGKAATVASDVPIVSVLDHPVEQGGTLGSPVPSQPPAVLVAVTPHDAAAIGSATAARSGGLGGGIQLALHANA